MSLDSKAVLKKYFGYDSFRKGQENIINNIIEKQDAAAIMPTGAGKSICYQVPALMMEGITIVVSPLISLMKDQVDTLEEMGVKATFINSTLSNIEMNERLVDIEQGKYKIIYIAPERLESISFRNAVDNAGVSFVAVDEAHCVSQWAHDFRPSYKKITSFIRCLSKRPVVGAFTATATEKVKEDIINMIGLINPHIYVTGFDRENLSFTVLRGENKDRFIANYVHEHKDSIGIIYTSTRKETERIYNMLLSNEIKAGVYHAGLSDGERSEAQNNFAFDDVNVMVATNAFGMGIDKSNVRYVIHNNIPKNMEAYYQEAGRAGRDGEQSECILLYSPQDIQLQRYFIDESQLPEVLKTNEYEKLNAMVDYCNTTKCLRKCILEYFGDEVEYEQCDNCSNCSEDMETVDITLESQKIFSCIYRMKQNFGSGMIADVLKASKNKKVLNFGFDKLSTYGLMRDYDRKIVIDYINKLTADGYLNLTNSGYPILRLTQKAVDVLKKGEKVEMKQRKVKKVIKEESLLFERLKNLRKEIAVEENVPPYVIFSDASLREMSMYMPLEKDDCLEVKGVGEKKYEKYGDRFINVIEEYISEKDISMDYIYKERIKIKGFIIRKDGDTEPKKPRKRAKSDKVPTHMITYEMFTKGKNIDEICDARNLKRMTVEGHIAKCVEEGLDVNIEDIVPEKYREMILKTFDEIGSEHLKPVKEVLPEEVEYFWIRIMKASID